MIPTQQEIIELAKQADVAVQVQTGRVGGGWDTSYIITPDIERFATLVRAAALEDAAGVCDAQDMESFGVLPIRAVMITNACAAAIRQLKGKQ